MTIHKSPVLPDGAAFNTWVQDKGLQGLSKPTHYPCMAILSSGMQPMHNTFGQYQGDALEQHIEFVYYSEFQNWRYQILGPIKS
jgi:hypothetical protein